VLLAALPPDELDRRLVDWKPAPVTPRAITDVGRLRAELARTAWSRPRSASWARRRG
jgi:DNA-binding IclR family transcriptional regulator